MFMHTTGALWQSADQACQKRVVNFYSMLSKMDNPTVLLLWGYGTETFTTNVSGTIHRSGVLQA